MSNRPFTTVVEIEQRWRPALMRGDTIVRAYEPVDSLPDACDVARILSESKNIYFRFPKFS